MKRKKKAWIYSGSALAVAIVGTALSFWCIQISRNWNLLQQAPKITEKEKFDASLAVAQFLVNGIGTVATIVGGIVVWFTFKETYKNTKLTESRLITERFSKAVELLGSENTEVRLGGIYSLDSLARDSSTIYWTVVELLTAFVRDKSSILDKETQRRLPKYDRDIQTIIIVLGKLNKLENIENQSLDFRGSNLNGFIFYPGSSFVRANFEDATLEKAKLSKVILKDANFTNANLISADLESADLEGAHLEGAFLYLANLKRANLEGTNLKNTHLHSATFIEANFENASLEGASFWSEEIWNHRHFNEEERTLIEMYLEDQRELADPLSEAESKDDPCLMQKPNFRKSNLTAIQAKSVKNEEWKEAFYNEALRQELGIPNYESYELEDF